MPKFQLPNGLSTSHLLEVTTLMETLWLMPSQLPTVAETQKELLDALSAAVIPALWSLWRHEIPDAKESAVARKVKQGIRDSFRFLRGKDSMVIRFALHTIPLYWEPPVVETEPDLPPHELQRYRLTAAFIAFFIQNHLVNLHARHAPDQPMRHLDRAVLNAVYGVLLTHPGPTWKLSLPAQVCVQAAIMKVGDLELPPVVGA